VADPTKPDTTQSPAADASNISPAPNSVTEAPPVDGSSTAPVPPPTSSGGKVQADPLSDGTVPTVLSGGSSHKTVTKGVANISSIYRRADILSTLLTFVGALVAAGIIFGIYAYFTRSKAPTAAAPKVTSLSKSDLDKLQTFFGGNSAGSSSQVLTISSASLFSGRVAMSSDLKVVGGLQVAGTTALGDLTVDKTTTLGVTNIRGQLIVAGPVNFQSPAQFGAGGSVSGNLAVTGNGTFGGSISAGTLNVQNLSVTGTLSLAGHISISGLNPSASPGSEAGSGANANINGNDAAGDVTVNTGTIPVHVGNTGGLDVVVTFHTAYPRAPHIVISAVGQNAARLMPYVLITATGFTIGGVNDAASSQTYTFDYWVVQ
jgi:hypothetical protein